MRRRTFVRGDFLWAFTFWRGIASKFAIYEGNVLGILYRVNGPIRNCEFLIWAKGEGGVSPSITPIFKKCKAT